MKICTKNCHFASFLVTVLFAYGSPLFGKGLSLGEFEPKVFIYDSPVDLHVEPSVDIKTTPFSAHILTDTTASTDSQKLINILSVILQHKPLRGTFGPCGYEVNSVRSFKMTVSGNTGKIDAVAPVTLSSCPLSSDDVALSMSVTPMTAPTRLSVKIVEINVSIPFLWKVAAFWTRPEQLIAAGLKKAIEHGSITLPKIDHARLAYQGASINSDGKNLKLRVRLDALIETAKIQEFLSGLDLIKNFTIRIPLMDANTHSIP
jgi:hypothetical protein